MTSRWFVMSVLAMGIAAMLPPEVRSQEVASEQQTIDVIVVTARKRQESLQEVPLSVSAFSADQIRSKGIDNNYDLANFTVNFNTQQQLGRRDDRPIIRGMTAPATRGEPNASYFIDGVFVSGSVSTASLGAVERIEVLRGPQSAQFGRATFSGAVNYVTRKPTNEFAGEASGRFGTNDNEQLGGWVSGPLIRDKLLFFLGANWEQYGGEWDNALAPNSAEVGLFINPPQRGDTSELGGTETTEVSTRLLFTPTDTAEIKFGYTYSEGDDDHFPPLPWTELNCFIPTDPSQPWWDKSNEGTPRNGAWCGEMKVDGLNARINIPDLKDGVQMVDLVSPGGGVLVAPPGDPGTRREQDRFLLEYVQGVGDWDFTLRGAYNRDDFEQVLDLDRLNGRPGVNLPPLLGGLFHFELRDTREDYSFEARVDTPTAGRFRGTLGAYYYDFEGDSRQRSFPGPGLEDFSPDRTTETTNTAVFGTFEYDITDRLTFALEARYAVDDKKITGANGIKADDDFESFTPRYTLRYEFNNETMIYGLVAKGTKPGDFNAAYFTENTPATIDPGNPITGSGDPRCFDGTPLGTVDALNCGQAIVEEEEAWTYEIGTKTTWLDGRVTANLALFYIDWTNQGQFQTASIARDPPINSQLDTIVVNAGESFSRGLELETSFLVTDALLVTAGYGYTDAEYDEFFSDFAQSITGNGDVSGNRLFGNPKHSVVVGLTATRALNAETEFFLRPDFVYESEREADETNLGYLDSRKLVNLRFGLEAESWVATAFVTNLLDDDTPTAASNFVDFTAPQFANGANRNIWTLNPTRGRNWGLELLYRF